MSPLTNEEFLKLKENLIFQNGISNWGGTRKLPYAFTEQGLAMLSGLLNSGIDMDETLRDQNDINESTRAQLDAISTALAELQAKPSETKTRKPIGFIQPENSDEEI